MSHKLPDEIISEILSPALEVAENMFSDTSSTSPFAVAGSPSCSSALLLVCKSWLRVATPLLYNVVVIRSKAQAGALQSALQSNPDLGQFVKKLRVEGGYGKSMSQILHKTPNVSDIFLSLLVHASDSTAGLALGLPLINPTRLIIHDENEFFLKNKNVVTLMTALATSVVKWSNLNTIHFPYHYHMTARESFCTALCSSPTVKILSFPTYNTSLEPYLIECARAPSLEAIEIRKVPHDAQTPLNSTDPRLGKLLRWANLLASKSKSTTRTLTQTSVCLPRDPSFRPMISVSQAVVELIWSRILFFAMLSLEQHPENTPAWMLTDKRINPKRRKLLLVSKLFHRVGLPYLYRCPVFLNASILSSLASVVVERPALGEHMRELDVRFPRSRDTVLGRETTAGSAPLASIVPHTHNLTHLIGGTGKTVWGGTCLFMSWVTFTALSEVAGTTLQQFSGFCLKSTSEKDVHSPSIFQRFTALCSFTWNYGARYAEKRRETDLFSAVDDITAAALPNLEFLEIESGNGLAVFSQMKLPSLRRAEFEIHGDWDAKLFLRVHGAKIQDLKIRDDTIARHSTFTLCPNMKTLACQAMDYKGHDFCLKALGSGFKHASLTKIIVDKVPKRGVAKEEQDWDDFLGVLDVSYFPALREVCIPSLEWPTKEQAIAKSVWVKWAEILLDHGIRLTDRTGANWRPRLKSKASRRQ
ncbi:hypothetical protein B0H11DRAFT_2104239 [Mycena galericulata]|nr:hypothetical protein B0H11DRAFT_2104239 [Mycena galericulata]